MVLLLTTVMSAFNIWDADTELTIVDILKIFSMSRFVFRDLLSIKSNLSAKVLWLHSGLSQKNFLLFSNIITCYLVMVDLETPFGILNEPWMISFHNKGKLYHCGLTSQR